MVNKIITKQKLNCFPKNNGFKSMCKCVVFQKLLVKFNSYKYNNYKNIFFCIYYLGMPTLLIFWIVLVLRFFFIL